MKRKIGLVAATLALLACAPVLAWNQPGASPTESSGDPPASSLEDEMRDLRRLLVQERAAGTEQRGTVLTFEQEMTDLRRASVLERQREPAVESGGLTLDEELRDLRRASVREQASRVRRQDATLTFEREMRDLRSEYRSSQQRRP